MSFFKKTQQTPRLSLLDKLKIWRILKDDDMLSKLKSRKLWVAVGTAAVTTLLNSLGFGQDLIDNIVNLAMLYIGAQGLADAAYFYNPVPAPQSTVIVEQQRGERV